MMKEISMTLVLLLVLGWPLLLAGWALFRLQAATSVGGVGRACLLAGYSAAVQLTNRRGERVLPLVHFIILAQVVHGYLALDILLLGRSGPPGLTVLGVFVATWLAYRYGRPALNRRFRAWSTATTLEMYSPAQRRAWGLLGHACFWGAFTFIFVCIGLRGKLSIFL